MKEQRLCQAYATYTKIDTQYSAFTNDIKTQRHFHRHQARSSEDSK